LYDDFLSKDENLHLKIMCHRLQ